MIHAHRVVAVVLGLAALGGCKKKEAAPAAGTGSSPTTGTGATAPSAAIDAAAPAAIDAAAAAALPAGVPADLPAFGPLAGADAAKAYNQALEALHANISGEGDPVALAVAAIKTDPGSASARAALACVAGDDAFDLAQLTPLATAADCAACVDVVLNLRSDADCEWSDAVLALATQVKPGPQRAAADAIVAWLGSGDPAAVTPFFQAAKVELVYEGKKKKLTGAKLLAQLTAQVKKAAEEDGLGGIVVEDGMMCAADCCVVQIDQLQHNHDFLQKLCFAPGTDQLASLELVSGE